MLPPTGPDPTATNGCPSVQLATSVVAELSATRRRVITRLAAVNARDSLQDLVTRIIGDPEALQRTQPGPFGERTITAAAPTAVQMGNRVKAVPRLQRRRDAHRRESASTSPSAVGLGVPELREGQHRVVLIERGESWSSSWNTSNASIREKRNVS